MSHLSGQGPRDHKGNPLITVIMPTPVLNTTLGNAALPVMLNGDLPHFNLELEHSTGDVANPVLEAYVDTGTGISFMHLSIIDSMCPSHLEALKQIFH